MSNYHKKQYKQVAAIIAEVKDQKSRDQLIRDFSRLFAGDNGAFDSGRFIRAAGGIS